MRRLSNFGRTTLAWIVPLGLGLTLAACARPDVQAPARMDDYVFPTWQPGDVRPEEGEQIQRAWREVLAGHTRKASERMTKLLRRRPNLASAETVLAYAALRDGALDAAAAGFVQVLGRRPADGAALVGAGATALRRGDVESAFAYYTSAAEQRPDDEIVRRRLEALEVQVVERYADAGRLASQRGEHAEAARQFERAVEIAPSLAEVRIALAEAWLAVGDRDAAIATLRAVPDEDRRVLLRLAALHEESGDTQSVLDVYRRLLSRDAADPQAREEAAEIARRIEEAGAGPEYRRIPRAARVTRADLAALLSLKLTALGRVAEGQPAVAVDLSGTWARRHILRVLAYGLMDVYPNHTFQPGALIRRGELAHAAGQVLDLLGAEAVPPLEIGDMSANHRYHRGASRVVQTGLMELTGAGDFEPWRLVTGAEATRVVEGLARQVGP